MKNLIRIILIIFGALLILGWVTITFLPEKLAPLIIARQVNQLRKQNDRNEQLLADTERIRIYTVGTSSPMPGKRVQTGTAVIVNGHFFMFDVGDGVVRKAEDMGLPLDHLDGIFMTHWHSDHMMDLPRLINRSWLLGRTNDLHLYGPEGTDTLNQAINQYLQIENRHRVDHHGIDIMDISKARAIPHEFVLAGGSQKIIYQQDGITITAFDVNHEPIEPAVGYAIEYQGKKVIISGDTKKNELVQEMAQNADVLIHEVLMISFLKQMETELEARGMLRNQKIIHDIQDYHTAPAEVVEVAEQARVKKLVLHHFGPAPDYRVIKNLYKKELQGFTGQIHFAKDGDVIVVE